MKQTAFRRLINMGLIERAPFGRSKLTAKGERALAKATDGLTENADLVASPPPVW